MPFKFWKKDKPEKEKGAPEEKKPSEKAGAKPDAVGEKTITDGGVGPAAPSAPSSGAQLASSTKSPEPAPGEMDAAVSEVHAALVELGLTIAGTKTVFGKRVAASSEARERLSRNIGRSLTVPRREFWWIGSGSGRLRNSTPRSSSGT